MIYNYNAEKEIVYSANLFTGKLERQSLTSLKQIYRIYYIDMRNNTFEEDRINIKRLFEEMFNRIK